MRQSSRDAWVSGLFAALIGYGTIVVAFALTNVVQGRSLFHTPALLGGALFFGLDDPAMVDISPGPVLTYNMVHLLAFLALGMLASWLVEEAERHPAARYLVLFVLVFVAVHVYTALLLFAMPLLRSGGWIEIGMASILAAAAMGWFLFARHPALRAELRENPIGAE